MATKVIDPSPSPGRTISAESTPSPPQRGRPVLYFGAAEDVVSDDENAPVAPVLTRKRCNSNSNEPYPKRAKENDDKIKLKFASFKVTPSKVPEYDGGGTIPTLSVHTPIPSIEDVDPSHVFRVGQLNSTRISESGASYDPIARQLSRSYSSEVAEDYRRFEAFFTELTPDAVDVAQYRIDHINNFTYKDSVAETWGWKSIEARLNYIESLTQIENVPVSFLDHAPWALAVFNATRLLGLLQQEQAHLHSPLTWDEHRNHLTGNIDTTATEHHDQLTGTIATTATTAEVGPKTAVKAPNQQKTERSDKPKSSKPKAKATPDKITNDKRENVLDWDEATEVKWTHDYISHKIINFGIPRVPDPDHKDTDWSKWRGGKSAAIIQLRKDHHEKFKGEVFSRKNGKQYHPRPMDIDAHRSYLSFQRKIERDPKLSALINQVDPKKVKPEPREADAAEGSDDDNKGKEAQGEAPAPVRPVTPTNRTLPPIFAKCPSTPSEPTSPTNPSTNAPVSAADPFGSPTTGVETPKYHRSTGGKGIHRPVGGKGPLSSRASPSKTSISTLEEPARAHRYLEEDYDDNEEDIVPIKQELIGDR
jgi:hypothetical protein